MGDWEFIAGGKVYGFHELKGTCGRIGGVF